MGVNLPLLKTLFERTRGRVTYKLGAKPPLGSDSSAFSESDCSGFVRWALDRAGYRIPDGSQTEWDWCEKAGLHQVRYLDAERFAGKDTRRLFIAFEAAHPIGHVWLGVSDGKHMRTIECHGGTVHRGVDSRPWSALAGIAAACYELPVAG